MKITRWIYLTIIEPIHVGLFMIYQQYEHIKGTIKDIHQKLTYSKVMLCNDTDCLNYDEREKTNCSLWEIKINHKCMCFESKTEYEKIQQEAINDTIL